MEAENEFIKWSPKQLYLAGLIISLIHVSNGCVFTWPSPTLPKLDTVLTVDQKSWIASLSTLGAALGPVIIALTIDTLGRKKTLYILGSCFLASWAILVSSFNPYVMYLGRIIGGIGLGGSFGSVAVFIGEIADNKRRSSICSYAMIFLGIGMIMEYCIGPYVSYSMLILASASPALLFIVLLYILPESPHFLLAKGKITEAEEALSWYRGNAELKQIQPELNEIQASIANKKRGSLKSLFVNKGSRQAVGISIFLLAIQQASAQGALLSLTQSIFDKANMNMSAAISSMFIGFASLLASLPAPLVVKKLGLKKAVIYSGFSTAITMGIMSTYFFVDSKIDKSSIFRFLPIVTLVLNVFCSSFGLAPCPWAFVAEAFSLEVRGIAASFCGVCSSLIGFAATSGFAFILYYASPEIVFGGFSIVLFVMSLLAIFIVPNTKGMSLKQIQDFFNQSSKIAE